MLNKVCFSESDEDLHLCETDLKSVRNMYVDFVSVKCMRLEAYDERPKYVLCGNIDEYLRYEQHRSDLAQCVKENNIKVENEYYGNVLVMTNTKG